MSDIDETSERAVNYVVGPIENNNTRRLLSPRILRRTENDAQAMVRVRLTSRKTINPVASRLALPAMPGAGSAKLWDLSWARALAKGCLATGFLLDCPQRG